MAGFLLRIDGHEFLGRFDRGIAWLEAQRVSEAVVVSHGAAIRGWTAARVHGVTPEFAAANALHNTGRVVIEQSANHGWELTTWVSDPALPGEMGAEPADDPTGAGLGELRQSTQ